MRREKEIAESRFEVAQGESLRHRLRVEHLERELRELQESFSAERERMQVSWTIWAPSGLLGDFLDPDESYS